MRRAREGQAVHAKKGTKHQEYIELCIYNCIHIRITYTYIYSTYNIYVLYSMAPNFINQRVKDTKGHTGPDSELPN